VRKKDCLKIAAILEVIEDVKLEEMKH